MHDRRALTRSISSDCITILLFTNKDSSVDIQLNACGSIHFFMVGMIVEYGAAMWPTEGELEHYKWPRALKLTITTSIIQQEQMQISCSKVGSTRVTP